MSSCYIHAVAKRSKQAKPEPTGESAPSNNPFAALAALSGAAPKAAPRPGGLRESPPRETADDLPPAHADLSAVRGKLVLQREKKGRRGKTVTRVRGLPEPERWQKEFKKRLGCGASIEEGELVLLGDLGDRAAALLKELGAKQVIVGN